MSVDGIHQVEGHIVDHLRPLAAAERKDYKIIFIYIEVRPRFRGLHIVESLSDRIAHIDVFLRFSEILTGLRKTQEYLGRKFLQRFVCNAGKSVLLMQITPGAVSVACEHDWNAHETACSNDHVRFEFLHNPQSLPDAFHGGKPSIEDLEDIPAVQPFRRHQLHRVSCLRYDCLFQTDIIADIQNFRLRLFLFYFISDGNGRINMTARASACYNHSHKFPPNGVAPIYEVNCWELLMLLIPKKMSRQATFDW